MNFFKLLVKVILSFAKRSPVAFCSTVVVIVGVVSVLSYSLAENTEWRCAFRAKWFGSVPDRLATYVIVGYGDKPYCPLPNDQLAHQIAAGKPLTIWVRAVHFDHVDVPSEPLQVDIEIINAKTGSIVETIAPKFLLNPTTVNTKNEDVRGFSYGYIVFTSSEREIYRARAKYLDAEIPSYSLGPPIVVF
jgi:hypothetical protein